MVERDVAPGVHRIEDANTNWYLIEDDDGITIVDCGIPASWDSLQAALGGRIDDVRAIVLTHGHFDHVGFAERARTEAMRAGGAAHDELATRHGLIFVVRRAEMDYLRPARLDELITVTTSTVALGGASLP